MNPNEVNKHGYLNSNFKLFHLKDKKAQNFEFHYHDFNKIIIFISGKVTYHIEGKSYELKPWDILLINNHDIHKPVIDPSEAYERIIIWVNFKFIELHNSIDCDLLTCFNRATEKRFNLVRLSSDLQTNLKSIIYSLESSINSNEFGSKLLSNSLFIQLIIYLNRIHIQNMYENDPSLSKYDEQICAILEYINTNLYSNLSVSEISKKFYISNYHLMHKFKKETGYTVYNYILQKKLITAKDLIKSGNPIVKTSLQLGFNDYSSFLRSFKKSFGISPKDFQQNSDYF